MSWRTPSTLCFKGLHALSSSRITSVYSFHTRLSSQYKREKVVEGSYKLPVPAGIFSRLAQYPYLPQARHSVRMTEIPKQRYVCPLAPVVVDVARDRFTVIGMKCIGTMDKVTRSKFTYDCHAFSLSICAPVFQGDPQHLRRKLHLAVSGETVGSYSTSVNKKFSPLPPHHLTDYSRISINRMEAKYTNYADYKSVGKNCSLLIQSRKKGVSEYAVYRNKASRSVRDAFTKVAFDTQSPLLYFDAMIRVKRPTLSYSATALRQEMQRAQEYLLKQISRDKAHNDAHLVATDTESDVMPGNVCRSSKFHGLYIHPQWIDTSKQPHNTPYQQQLGRAVENLPTTPSAVVAAFPRPKATATIPISTSKGQVHDAPQFAYTSRGRVPHTGTALPTGIVTSTTPAFTWKGGNTLLTSQCYTTQTSSMVQRYNQVQRGVLQSPLHLWKLSVHHERSIQAFRLLPHRPFVYMAPYGKSLALQALSRSLRLGPNESYLPRSDVMLPFKVPESVPVPQAADPVVLHTESTELSAIKAYLQQSKSSNSPIFNALTEASVAKPSKLIALLTSTLAAASTYGHTCGSVFVGRPNLQNIASHPVPLLTSAMPPFLQRQHVRSHFQSLGDPPVFKREIYIDSENRHFFKIALKAANAPKLDFVDQNDAPFTGTVRLLGGTSGMTVKKGQLVQEHDAGVATTHIVAFSSIMRQAMHSCYNNAFTLQRLRCIEAGYTSWNDVLTDKKYHKAQEEQFQQDCHNAIVGCIQLWQQQIPTILDLSLSAHGDTLGILRDHFYNAFKQGQLDPVKVSIQESSVRLPIRSSTLTASTQQPALVQNKSSLAYADGLWSQAWAMVEFDAVKQHSKEFHALTIQKAKARELNHAAYEYTNICEKSACQPVCVCGATELAYNVMDPQYHYYGGCKSKLEEVGSVASLVNFDALHTIQRNQDLISDILTSNYQLYDMSLKDKATKLTRLRLKQAVFSMLHHYPGTGVCTAEIPKRIASSGDGKFIKHLMGAFQKNPKKQRFSSIIQRYQFLTRLYGSTDYTSASFEKDQKQKMKQFHNGQGERYGNQEKDVYSGYPEFPENASRKELSQAQQQKNPISGIARYKRILGYKDIHKMSKMTQIKTMLRYDTQKNVTPVQYTRVALAPANIHHIVRNFITQLIRNDELALIIDIAPLFRKMMLETMLIQNKDL